MKGDKEQRFFSFDKMEIRAQDEGKKPLVTGYAAVFEKYAQPMFFGMEQVKEKIKRGAFTKSIKERDVLALWSHNWDIPLARSSKGQLNLREDDKGLGFELELPDTTAGRDAEVCIRTGIVEGMSFGFIVTGEEWERESEGVYVRTLTEVDLYEISPTALPAYPQTTVSARGLDKSLEEFKATLIEKTAEPEKAKAQEAYFHRRLKLNQLMNS